MKKWQDKLHNVYVDFEEFVSYCEIYGIHTRLGYRSMKKCWGDNPLVEGSVNPTDYRKLVQKRATT
jgi:hypothetical protein